MSTADKILLEWYEARKDLLLWSYKFEQTKKGNEVVETPELTAAWHRLARAEGALDGLARSVHGQ